MTEDGTAVVQAVNGVTAAVLALVEALRPAPGPRLYLDRDGDVWGVPVGRTRPLQLNRGDWQISAMLTLDEVAAEYGPLRDLPEVKW